MFSLKPALFTRDSSPRQRRWTEKSIFSRKYSKFKRFILYLSYVLRLNLPMVTGVEISIYRVRFESSKANKI